ncbi:MAG: DUF2780 domain-containing protein [Phycisphaerales bacterium JB063]
MDRRHRPPHHRTNEKEAPMDLVNELVSKLGIDAQQAKGGAGMILGLVKEKLGASDFAKVKEAVPEADQLAADAPEAGGGILGAVGGLASALGAGGVGDLAKLAGGFEKLGLDADMVGKFVPVIMNFVKKQGGDGIGNIVAAVLGGKD